MIVAIDSLEGNELQRKQQSKNGMLELKIVGRLKLLVKRSVM
jgi:hypothetical protein